MARPVNLATCLAKTARWLRAHGDGGGLEVLPVDAEREVLAVGRVDADAMEPVLQIKADHVVTLGGEAAEDPEGLEPAAVGYAAAV